MKGTKEQEVFRGAERMIWAIFAEEVSDVAGVDVVDGLLCCC